MTAYNRIVFNDGEALTHGDLNDLQAGLITEALETSVLSGAQLGNAHNIAYQGSSGVDPFKADGHSRGDTLHQSRLYSPAPMSGIVIPDSGSAPTTLSLGKGLLVQRRTASTPGTPISSDVPSIDTPLVHGMSASVRNLVTDITGNAPPGAGNPRWDTWGVRLRYDRATASRNYQDAVTGALSSASGDKDCSVGIETEFVAGAQSATFDMATLSAGYVPVLTKRRPSGSDPSPYVPTDFYYHVYPMRLGVETIMPSDGYLTGQIYLDGTSPGYVLSDVAVPITRGGSPSSTTAIYISRQMHAGCRLIGVAFMTAQSPGPPVLAEIYRISQLADGTITGSVIVDLSTIHARLINASSRGFRGCGESDWSPANKPLPIWGNGRSYGPLFSDYRRDLSYDASAPYDHAQLDMLAIRVSVNSTNYGMGPMRLYYLY